ncbi:STAS-like domain-containing protein [Stutzerimonas kunmingensis]|uniref:STAS-like domain-containing protein n=1 Tax=Stutzerimonas kunmingensis TaxID=1211807 RepID=UPI0024203070|nr:STAS-like domain-containing protein [Stutzerimonas kunmingensis]
MSRIKVFELTGKNAISMQSGEKLYNALQSQLTLNNSLLVDFEGVELFASPFFNASIGLLLKDISIESLQQKLSVINLSDVGRDLLNHVIANAIAFYGDSEKISNAIDQNKAGDENE